jgi:hypothetical protein
MLEKLTEFEFLIVTIYRQYDKWTEFYHSFPENERYLLEEVESEMDDLFSMLTYCDEEEAKTAFADLQRRMKELMAKTPAPATAE